MPARATTPFPAELSAPKGKVSNCAGLSWVYDLRLRGAFQGFVVLRVRGRHSGLQHFGAFELRGHVHGGFVVQDECSSREASKVCVVPVC